MISQCPVTVTAQVSLSCVHVVFVVNTVALGCVSRDHHFPLSSFCQSSMFILNSSTTGAI